MLMASTKVIIMHY